MIRIVTVCSIALLIVLLSVNLADACPSCAQAVAEGSADSGGSVPKAFQYSIFFMMSMPFLLLGGFCFAFYRLQRRAAAENYVPVNNPSDQ